MSDLHPGGSGKQTRRHTIAAGKTASAEYPHLVRGIVCALAGGSLWGFSGSCAQYLLSTYAITPIEITSLRMLGAGVLFMAILLIRHRDKLVAIAHDKKALVQLVIFGAGGLFLSQITYTTVVGYTNAGTATVLQCSGTIFVVLFTCLFARRMPRAAETVGLVLTIAATWLIATKGDPSQIVLPVAGLLWGLANGLSVAFYIMYPKRLLKEYGSLAATGCGFFIGGIIIGCIVLPQVTLPALDGAGMAALAAIIVLGTCASYWLYLQGVADAGPVRASMLGVAEPISATIISWLWLGTQFSWADLLGFVLMIAMVLIVSRSNSTD